MEIETEDRKRRRHLRRAIGIALGGVNAVLKSDGVDAIAFAEEIEHLERTLDILTEMKDRAKRPTSPHAVVELL